MSDEVLQAAVRGLQRELDDARTESTHLRQNIDALHKARQFDQDAANAVRDRNAELLRLIADIEPHLRRGMPVDLQDRLRKALVKASMLP